MSFLFTYIIKLAVFTVHFLIFSAVSTVYAQPQSMSPPQTMMEFGLSSPVFKDGGRIPLKYTCDGANISPPLSWSGVPAGTERLVLIVDDPDAAVGSWTHWVLYNISVQPEMLEENVPAMDALINGVGQGTNSFKYIGYGGPCPPVQDEAHRYVFTLYALDTELKLIPGQGIVEIEAAMDGRILAKTTLTGMYDR